VKGGGDCEVRRRCGILVSSLLRTIDDEKLLHPRGALGDRSRLRGFINSFCKVTGTVGDNMLELR
jgi:hypothetical protein